MFESDVYRGQRRATLEGNLSLEYAEPLKGRHTEVLMKQVGCLTEAVAG